MDENKKAVATRIKAIRLEKGMNLEEFGKLFGVSKSTVSHWESGTNLPNAERLKTIAKIGDITVNELLYGNLLAPDTLELWLESGSFHYEFLPKFENFIKDLKGDKFIGLINIDTFFYFEKLYGRLKIYGHYETMKLPEDENAIEKYLITSISYEYEKILLREMEKFKNKDDDDFLNKYASRFEDSFLTTTTLKFMNNDTTAYASFLEIVVKATENYSKQFPKMIEFILNRKINTTINDINTFVKSDSYNQITVTQSGIFKNKEALTSQIDFEDYAYIQKTLMNLMNYIETNIGDS